MKLAEGKKLPRRLMAAMAQQDCGQCGYNCKDYADALFAKSEKRLNLCVPGGKETSRMLKQLYQELDGVSGGAPAAPPAPTATPRQNPRLPPRPAARVRHFPGQRSRSRCRGACGARRAGGFSDRRPHLPRSADRRRFAIAGARHAVRAEIESDRRRAAAARRAFR